MKALEHFKQLGYGLKQSTVQSNTMQLLWLVIIYSKILALNSLRCYTSNEVSDIEGYTENKVSDIDGVCSACLMLQ